MRCCGLHLRLSLLSKVSANQYVLPIHLFARSFPVFLFLTLVFVIQTWLKFTMFQPIPATCWDYKDSTLSSWVLSLFFLSLLRQGCLYSPDCPGTCCINHAILKFIELCLSLSPRRAPLLQLPSFFLTFPSCPFLSLPGSNQKSRTF